MTATCESLYFDMHDALYAAVFNPGFRGWDRDKTAELLRKAQDAAFSISPPSASLMARVLTEDEATEIRDASAVLPS